MMDRRRRPTRGIRVLRREMLIQRSPEELFPFFSDARNLEKITPTFLRFQLVTPSPIEMRAGTQIEYVLRVRGIRLRWRSDITFWEPPHRFVDVQLLGPYRWWHHEHRFESVPGGTRAVDAVEYAVPGGWLVDFLFVRRDLRRIFDYREAALRRIFPGAGVQAATRS